MAGQDVIAISDSTQREAESEILKRPSRAHLEHYQSLLDGHAKSLSLLRGKIHDPAQLPQPVHTLVAPDQSEKNDELVYTLERLTEKASRQLTLAEDAVARYSQAVDTLDQAQNLRADVDTALVALQALLRLLSQQARITPPQRGKDVLDVSDSVEEQKLHQLWQALNKENQTSPKMLESGSKNLESLRTIGVDPNFVCDMSNLLVAFRAETVIAKRVSEDIQARLERIQEGRRIGAKSAELLSLMEKGRNQVTAFIHQKLWREDWQETPDECEVELPKEQTSQLKQSIRQLSDAAQHFDWPGLQAVCEERLAAIDAAMIFLAQLLEVHKNARDQSIATVQQLQSAEEICVTIDQTMTDMSLATDERFTFLESSAQNYLNSITHAVSFIASPVRLDGLPDLVQHDASVRKALNTASSRVASASHRLQHHRRRLSLKSELDCIARDVATLSSSVETNHRGVELLRGALEKTDRESSKLKNLMDELPSTADLQPLRRRSQSLLKGLQSLPDDTGDFEDLSNYRNSMIHRLHDLVTKIEDSEVSLQSLTQAVLHFLSEDDARRATERINRERDEKEQREAERRHGEWEKAWQANMDQIDRIGRDLAASSPPADRVEQSVSVASCFFFSERC